MSTSDDINALLGISPNEIVQQARQVKHELATISPENLGEKIIEETNDIMDSARQALAAVLDEVQSTPNDAELVESASKLIQAQAGLIDALSKLHLNREKFNQQVALTKMRLSAEQQMNTENNQTKMLVSRGEIMERLFNDARKVNVIDITDELD
jgi:biotin-(acetyl-CoA carboxylase) ligase